MACKVLQTKLWATQIVIRVAEEPVCITRGPGHSVLVATRSGMIELHCFSNGRSHMISKFRTCSSRIFFLGLAVLPVLLQEAIVTIEAQRDGSDMQALSVYTNWTRDKEPRVAQLMLSSSVSALAVCEAESGRFALATTNFITLYQCSDDGSAITPVLEVAVCRAAKLALFGEYLGWSKGTIVHVVKCRFSQNDALTEVRFFCSFFLSFLQKKGVRKNSSGVDFVVAGGAGQASRLDVPSLAKGLDPFVALGPFRNLSVSVRAEEGWRLVSCDTMLMQRASSEIHSLRICSEPNIANASLPKTEELLVRCLASTADVAMLFSLSRPSLLARYTYASATFMAVLDSSFLYALQTANDRQGASLVEVFSLRPSSAALPLRQLGELSDWTLLPANGGTGEYSPDLPAPCMMASLPFVGLQSVTAVKTGSVALMSKMISKKDAFWSVSVLFPERAVSVWRELASKAALVKQNDPDTFLLFHLEGLLVLGSRLCQLTAEKLPIDVSMAFEASATEEREESADFNPLDLSISADLAGAVAVMDDYDATHSLFLESCRVLGDFCEAKRMFEAAAIFWGFCLMPIDEVTRRLLPERQAATALVEFLNRALKVVRNSNNNCCAF
jgi:hypothetical protein